MYNRDFTPERITRLAPNEVFVFGSNLLGHHAGGAARIACERFGAVWGQGVGMQGQCYAIPTMHGGVDVIKPYVDGFVAFAFNHREYRFLVTRIGCGIAGFTPDEIAPLFAKALDLENVILPKDFVELLDKSRPDTDGDVHGWDAKGDFLDEYHHWMGLVQQGNDNAYGKVKELRVREYLNTIDIVNHGFYYAPNGQRVELPSSDSMQRGTVFYEQEFHVKTPMVTTNGGHSIVEVVNEDCLEVGMRLKAEGCNPAILNMANRRNPGGSVLTGAAAQEETLFRRTNLFRSLYQFAPYAAQYGIACSSHHYPMDRNYGGVYTPGAICFRHGEQEGYALMDEPVSLSFITVAGMNRPDLTPDGKIADHHVEPVKNKMRTILRIGLQQGHDSLVLGALGCGAFCNPPRHVARLFHEVLGEPEFENKFVRIVFAIIDDHNARRRHNPEGNYKPFAEEFAGMDSPQLTDDEQKALMLWKMGAGNSAKRFNGENPIPEKTKVATADSWKTLPMPERNTILPMQEEIPATAMSIVKMGHIPDAMEDHWFMYCDGDTIRYYRSWTGICVYVAKYELNGETCRITSLQVNRDPDQYGNTDDAHDRALFMALLTEEYGGDATGYWDAALK